MGDVVYFSPVNAQDPWSNLLIADGFQSLRCGVTINAQGNSPIPSIDRSLFRIWSCAQTTQIDDSGITLGHKERLMEQLTGEIVTYGMPIAFEHVLSGQFLAASPRELADIEKECTKLQLVLNGSSTACQFAFKPLLKSRSDGEVYFHDEVSLMNLRLDLLVHQAPGDSLYNAFDPVPVVEVNLADKKETDNGCYEWKIHKHTLHSHKQHNCLQVGVRQTVEVVSGS